VGAPRGGGKRQQQYQGQRRPHRRDEPVLSRRSLPLHPNSLLSQQLLLFLVLLVAIRLRRRCIGLVGKIREVLTLRKSLGSAVPLSWPEESKITEHTYSRCLRAGLTARERADSPHSFHLTGAIQPGSCPDVDARAAMEKEDRESRCRRKGSRTRKVACSAAGPPRV